MSMVNESDEQEQAWIDGYDTADKDITPLLRRCATERKRLRRVIEAAKVAHGGPHRSTCHVCNALYEMEEEE